MKYYKFTLEELVELFSIVWITTNKHNILLAIAELNRRKEKMK